MLVKKCVIFDSPLNLPLEHIFRWYHWFLTALSLRSPPTICRCNNLEVGVFVTVPCPPSLDLDQESTCSVIQEDLLADVASGWCWRLAKTAAPVAVDHKRRRSRCTQTIVSSHHLQRPEGLGCACEWGAYFVFLSPDSDPWGTFHPEMCSLLFPAHLYVSAGTIKKH